MNCGRITAGLMALALLVGCNREAQTVDVSSGAPRMAEAVTEVPAQAGAPIADIPMPVGFKLDQEHSRNATAAGARFIDHVYAGDGDKRQVHMFFKRQMPISRWALMRDVFAQGSIQMDFDNSRETCRIVITESTSIWPWSKPVKVSVVVLPMGKIHEDMPQSGAKLSMR
jgi:hypothetical protein